MRKTCCVVAILAVGAALAASSPCAAETMGFWVAGAAAAVPASVSGARDFTLSGIREGGSAGDVHVALANANGYSMGPGARFSIYVASRYMPNWDCIFGVGQRFSAAVTLGFDVPIRMSGIDRFGIAPRFGLFVASGEAGPVAGDEPITVGGTKVAPGDKVLLRSYGYVGSLSGTWTRRLSERFALRGELGFQFGKGVQNDVVVGNNDASLDVPGGMAPAVMSVGPIASIGILFGYEPGYVVPDVANSGVSGPALQGEELPATRGCRDSVRAANTGCSSVTNDDGYQSTTSRNSHSRQWSWWQRRQRDAKRRRCLTPSTPT